MRPIAGLILAAGLIFSAMPVSATDEASLIAEGFSVVKTTTISGQFDGCERGKKIPFADGAVFICSGFGYMHASNPKAVVLKSKTDKGYKLLVRGTPFNGALG